MKYVLSLVTGLLLGAAVALTGLYFNPLTQTQSGPFRNPEWRLDYGVGGSNTWLLTHDRKLDMPVVPAGAPLLFEDGIKGTLLTAMPLTPESGSDQALATRISVPSSDTEFLRTGLLVEDHWLISVPGQGTVYVNALNNQWPLLRDTVVRVDWLRRDFLAPGSYEPTRGPAAAGAEVAGLTGTYAGARGYAHEQLSLDSYNGSLVGLTGRIMISLSDPDTDR